MHKKQTGKASRRDALSSSKGCGFTFALSVDFDDFLAHIGFRRDLAIHHLLANPVIADSK